jgi:two-component system sensor histidine kinase KdpD
MTDPTIPAQQPPANQPPAAAKLRVYLGAAPGVGKTYRMLDHARELRSEGVDVVVGFVEPHGRAETVAALGDLEIIPRKIVQYQSITIEEMDLDAIIARHPNTVVVDELAHSNVPGSKHRKRYEDVLDLLEAGINVMTAVNVQHIESLNDAVSRSASTPIRETIPDSFLNRADEIVNIDVTVEELRSRLREGKIYGPEKIEQALANFFRKGNLNTLRELTLRTTAEKVSTAASEYRRTVGLEQAPIPEKVMVCLSSRPGSEKLLRVGSRIAGRLGTSWFAVYVESPKSTSGADHETMRRTEDYMQLATDLGARVVVLKEKNIADALIHFAKRENISHVVFGQPARSRLDIMLRGSVLNRFLSEMRETTVQVVPMQKKKK